MNYLGSISINKSKQVLGHVVVRMLELQESTRIPGLGRSHYFLKCKDTRAGCIFHIPDYREPMSDPLLNAHLTVSSQVS